MAQTEPDVGAPIERQVRPLADRLRDSVELLEREIDRLRAIARDAEMAAVDFQRDILAVRRYCSDVQQAGTVNERVVARTVTRMLERLPAA